MDAAVGSVIYIACLSMFIFREKQITISALQLALLQAFRGSIESNVYVIDLAGGMAGQIKIFATFARQANNEKAHDRCLLLFQRQTLRPTVGR